jgi:tetratricopeptide (TPR) repeat protein
MGLNFLGQGMYPEALSCFDKAIELDPNGSLTYSNKDETYSLWENLRRENPIILQ